MEQYCVVEKKYASYKSLLIYLNISCIVYRFIVEPR